MNTRLILLFVLIGFSGFELHASDVKFHNINAMYGISMRETASVCSDDNGFIWVSSKASVLRLTDDDYRIYQLPYQTADVLHTKLVYKNHVLLAYTNNGQIFRYNMILDRFDFLFDMRNPLNSIHIVISNMLIENRETFWISSTLGLFKYQNDELTLVHEDITSRATWYDDKHLIIANNNGLWLIDAATGERTHIYEHQSLSPLVVTKLFYDSSAGKLWIGTQSNGLFRYDFKNHTFSKPDISPFPKQPVFAIGANTESTILIGIDGQGIWELDKNNDRVLNIYKENMNDPASLHGDGVYDIYCDRNQRVWVCTYTGGVSFFDQVSSPVLQISHQINNDNSLNNNNVNHIIEDSDGNVWFATDNGISRWEVKANHWKTFYQNKEEQSQVFLTLCEDNQGRIWAGTFSSGVYVLDKTGKELARYSKEVPNSLVGNYVFDILKDSRGDIWIGGTAGELIRYRTNENSFQAYASFPMYAFAEFLPGQMLLACSYGLILLDAETSESRRLFSGYILHDLLVLDGNIWTCSSGNGLIYFDMKDQTTEFFTTESGLPSNYVNSIVYADDYLWLGTENGLCQFDPKNRTVLTYPNMFSLSRVSFNRNAQYKLKNGQLIWGTSNGAVLFDPSEIRNLQIQGKIFFQNLLVAGRSIREQLNTPLDSLQNLKLKYNQNTLTVELIPIKTTANARFSWNMEGLDKDWNQPSNARVVSYTNLPDGKFNLKIRLYDNSLSNILDQRELIIEVTPPFWRTWWFKLLVILFITGLVFFILNDYLQRIRQRHTEEKVRFFTNTAHDIRTSLTLIKAPIDELNKEQNLTDLGRHYLHLAMEQAQRLSQVATQLLDFQKIDVGKEKISLSMIDIVKLVVHRKLMFESFAKSKDIELVYESNQPVYMTAVDESMMEKVVDNLISNAVKYSHANSQVYITLDCRKKEWAFEVMDRGIGISKKVQRRLFQEFYRSENAINNKIIGSGIGLMLVKNYVVMHGGQITCESQENEGSTFKIIIPFKEVEKQKDTITVQNEKPDTVPVTNTKMQSQTKSGIQKKDLQILIVEDNDDLRNFMQYPLNEEYEASTAEDGVVAWDIIRKKMPDLVISDVMMPNMDGFELCRLLKSTGETSHIPVVLLTALSEKAEQLHGLGLGADDYLTKPFDMGILQQRIRSILKNREIVRQKALKLLKIDNDEPLLANELNDAFVKKAVKVVHSHISDPEFDKEQFASAMNVSSSLLYKKIKAFTDQSPVDFIKTVRLNHSLELLKTRKHSITEISELCGFSSVGYFSTVFKKHFGKSPSEF